MLREEPVGDTDSELVFCLLLEAMAEIWHNKDAVPSLEARFEVFAGFASDMRAHGPSNFLYSDGDTMFVHADKRCMKKARATVRRARLD